MRPLFEMFNNEELQRSKIMPTVAAQIDLEHEQKQATKRTGWLCCGKVDTIPMAPKEFQGMLD